MQAAARVGRVGFQEFVLPPSPLPPPLALPKPRMADRCFGMERQASCSMANGCLGRTAPWPWTGEQDLRDSTDSPRARSSTCRAGLSRRNFVVGPANGSRVEGRGSRGGCLWWTCVVAAAAAAAGFAGDPAQWVGQGFSRIPRVPPARTKEQRCARGQKTKGRDGQKKEREIKGQEKRVMAATGRDSHRTGPCAALHCCTAASRARGHAGTLAAGSCSGTSLPPQPSRVTPAIVANRA